jgi:phage baseplate assembly protein W
MTTNRNYKTYSFKSVGTKTKDAEVEAEVVEKPPIGIKTPLRLSNGNSLFDMHDDLANQISDNLRNLLLTNHGERLGQPDFGANLNRILFDLGSEDGDTQAIQQISASVGKYMPFVSLDGFQSFVEKNSLDVIAMIGIRVSYTVPAIDDKLRVIEVMLYMGG